MDGDRVLRQIKEVLDSPADRTSKARRVAEAVRLAGSYRWAATTF